MKRFLQSLLTSLAMLSIVAVANAKEPEDALIDKYDGKKGFTVGIMGKDIISMATQMPVGLSKEQKKFYEQTDEIIAIGYNGKNPTMDALYNEALGLFEAATHTHSENIDSNGAVGKAFTIIEGEFSTKISIIFKDKKALQILVMKGKYDKESLKEAKNPQQKMF